MEMVDSKEELKEFFKICDAGRGDCFCSEQDHPEFPNSRRRSVSRNRKPRKRTVFCEGDKSPSWSTTTFERLTLMIQYWIMLIYSLLLFMVIIFRNSIQDVTKFYYPYQRFPPMISWKVCTKLRIRESEQLETVLELYDMEIHQKISMPNYQKLKTMVKRSKDQKLRLRNFDARHERIETGAVVKSRKGLSGVERGKGKCYQWEEKGQCSKGDQCSFRHESNDRAQKPDHNAATPSEPSKEVSEAKVTMVPFFENRADII